MRQEKSKKYKTEESRRTRVGKANKQSVRRKEKGHGRI